MESQQKGIRPQSGREIFEQTLVKNIQILSKLAIWWSKSQVNVQEDKYKENDIWLISWEKFISWKVSKVNKKIKRSIQRNNDKVNRWIVKKVLEETGLMYKIKIPDRLRPGDLNYVKC